MLKMRVLGIHLLSLAIAIINILFFKIWIIFAQNPAKLIS